MVWCSRAGGLGMLTTLGDAAAGALDRAAAGAVAADALALAPAALAPAAGEDVPMPVR
jgi:hypothetical protein